MYHPNFKKESDLDVNAIELIDLHIDKVAHAGNPAHTENKDGSKKGFAGAKAMLRKDWDINDPNFFIETLTKNGFIMTGTAEVDEVPLSVIQKDYYSNSGSISSDDNKRYISWSASSSEEDPSNWIMHLKDDAGKPSGVSIHFGVSKDSKSAVRTIFFDTTKFNGSTAEAWLSKNLTSYGVIDMQMTEKELDAKIVSAMETVTKPILEKIDAMEKQRPEGTTKKAGEEAKKEEALGLEQAKKEAEELDKKIEERIKVVVPDLLKGISDKLDKISGTVMGTHTSKDKPVEEEDEEMTEDGETILAKDKNFTVLKGNRWTAPFLEKMDIRVVKNSSLRKKSPSIIADAIGASVAKTLSEHGMRG